MLKVLIVDDETSSRKSIVSIIKSHCPEVEVISEANSVKNGIIAVKQYSPDVVLLDIQLRDGTGFDLLNALEEVTFKLIFITSYHEYAIDAFNFSALDYILKPVDPDKLSRALDKTKLINHTDNLRLQLNAALKQINNNNKLQKLIVKNSEGVHLINIEEILRCEGDINYTTFFLTNGSKLVVAKTLKWYNNLLGEHGFIRVHRAHLVNSKYFRLLKREGRKNIVLMTTGDEIPASMNKKEILEFLEGYCSSGLE